MHGLEGIRDFPTSGWEFAGRTPRPTQSRGCRVTACACGSIAGRETEARNLPWHGGQSWVPHSLLETCIPGVSTELGSLTWIWGCRRQCPRCQSQWVPFLCDEGDAVSRQGTPRAPVSPELGRGKLARGRAWCRGHCARLSPLNGFLCPALLLPGASWDPSGSGSPSGDSSWGIIQLPLSCPPGTAMATLWGGHAGGSCGKRLLWVSPLPRCGCRRGQLFSLGSPGADSTSGVGCQTHQRRGANPRVLVAPPGRAPWGLAAGQRICSPSQKLPPQCPSPWHHACGLGWGAESRMSLLPPSLPASWGGN